MKKTKELRGRRRSGYRQAKELILRAGTLFGKKGIGRSHQLAALATFATGYALPTIIQYAGNRSADKPEDYFELAGAEAPPGPDVVRQGPARPPRSLSLMKWLGVAGLAAAAVALVMKPKKAY